MKRSRHPYAGGVAARVLLLASAIGLTCFGLVMVYSASSITAAVREGSSSHYLLRQTAIVAFSALIATVLARSDYRLLRDRAWLLWGGGVGLLIMTLAIGMVRGGAKRWIPLGVLSLQPSELAKVACVVLVAALTVRWQRGRLATPAFVKNTLVATCVPAVLIVIQPDLGTALTLIVGVVLVLFLAGVRVRSMSLVGLGIAGLAVVGIAIEPYRVERILSFTDPFADPLKSGWQSVQALYAFGTGGLDGVGLGLSRQKFFYLPEAHTDFILAIVGEEIGLIGTLMVVLGMAVFVFAGLRIASGARDPFGRLLAGGLAGTLGFQAMLNMASVTGIVPITGKPLPFLSYGGSSMLVTMICLGLLLSVSERGACVPRAVRLTSGSGGSAREVRDERWRDRRARVSGAERRRTARR